MVNSHSSDQPAPSEQPTSIPQPNPQLTASRLDAISSVRVNARNDQPRSSIWTRSKTLVNFWLDFVLLVLFLGLAWELAVLRFAFPKGAAEKWKLAGYSAADWQDLVFNTFCVFSLGVLVHVMLHWSWVIGTVQTRLLRRRATQDDGTHTMIGVGVLFILIHLLAGGILWARWAIVEQSSL